MSDSLDDKSGKTTAGAQPPKPAADPWTVLRLLEWTTEFFKNWDPKRDFAFAMLHAERLIQLLCETMIAELLLAQSRRHPERSEILERHLERAEPKARYLHDQISTTGRRLLEKLSTPALEAADQAAE